MTELTIEMRDGSGVLIVSETITAPTATDEQIQDMIALIQSGTPAHIAAHLATVFASAEAGT